MHVKPSFDKHGPISINRRTDSRLRLRQLAQAVRELLPREWFKAIGMHARAAASAAAAHDLANIRTPRVLPDTRPRAAGDFFAGLLERYAGARAADMDEAEIRDRAEQIATRARKLRFLPLPDGSGAWSAWARLCDYVREHGGVLRMTAKLYKLVPWNKRVTDPLWWRRQLRRWVVRTYEAGAYELGLIGAGPGMWYCSNRAVKRRIQQVRANTEMLMRTYIENDSGQRLTLWDVAQRSVSNKAIRRGELMTRVRGCEEHACAAGLQGIFTTNTCPSRFHAQKHGGGKNPKWDGSLPDAGQRWLCKTFQNLRNKWNRDGVRVMGFRVAEPHHDGTPHWHMLLWCRPEHKQYVCDSMREQWLKDDGDEEGADKHRFKYEEMIDGGATGYIAKYITKNIDDVHTPEGHIDDEVPDSKLQLDMLGDVEIKPAMRVESWATAWRIRQFQPIGQPSVTCWRELRRVTMQQAAAGSDALIHVWRAVHRERDRLASWRRYMQLQGGCMLARSDYRFCVHTIDRDRRGRYEEVSAKWACGIRDKRAANHLDVTPSMRREWGAEGFAQRHAAPPWTRFNNCTAHNRRSVGAVVNQLAEVRAYWGLGHDFSESGPP